MAAMSDERTLTAVDAFSRAAELGGFALDGLVVDVHGHDPVERLWSPDERRDVYSVSKTFTAVAVAIAVSEERFGLEDRVLDLLPEFRATAAPGVERVTVHQLLTMTSGIVYRWKDPDYDHPGDPAADILSTALGAEPGTAFAYRGGSSYLLSRIVHATTGDDLRDYLVPRLFTPLGIAHPQWLRCPLGFSMGALGLQLRPREIARLGRTLLDGGVYRGERLLPAQSVTAMPADSGPIAGHRPTGSAFPVRAVGYGRGVWLCGREGAWRMDGLYGQFCILIPRREACVTVTARYGGDTADILDALWETLIPAL